MLENVNMDRYAMIDLTQASDTVSDSQYQESLLGADGGATNGEIRDTKSRANSLRGELRVQMFGEKIDDEARLQAQKDTLGLATI